MWAEMEELGKIIINTRKFAASFSTADSATAYHPQSGLVSSILPHTNSKSNESVFDHPTKSPWPTTPLLRLRCSAALTLTMSPLNMTCSPG